MIKLFRTIRQKLVSESRFNKYVIYALGEIALVVIGILIALQINNWNEAYKNARMEKSYLINLQQDLISDLVRLDELKSNFEIAVKSKDFLTRAINLESGRSDSLGINFRNLSSFVTDFIPNATTIDELKNSNGLYLISNPTLRRQIVTLYNIYDDFLAKLKLGNEKAQFILVYTSRYIKNIIKPTDTEVSGLIKDYSFNNLIRMNYLYTQLQACSKAYDNCIETLNQVKKELER